MRVDGDIRDYKAECRNGHPRTEENTIFHRSTNGPVKPTCLDCRKASEVRNRGRQGRNEKVKIDAQPFAEWLKTKVEERGVQNAAAETRLPERTLWRLVNGRTARVHIDTVDGALLYTPTNMQELYPELFEFEEAVA
jgi:hypothetical protein